jgi:hypothetical protein
MVRWESAVRRRRSVRGVVTPESESRIPGLAGTGNVTLGEPDRVRLTPRNRDCFAECP